MKFFLLISALFALVAAHTAAPTGAAMKFYIFREDCFDKFFVVNDFTDQECLKVTISKAIGFAIVAGSGILKVPQILKIVSNGSVVGLSAVSYYIEVSINS